MITTNKKSNEGFGIELGAYPESPSYHKNSHVGAASSREIK